MPEITLPQGTVRYSESGSGDTIVLVHGLLVDGRLWRKVVPQLDGDFRVVVPDLPLGSHTLPLNDAADRTPAGIAKLLADFIEALDLRDVTLVGNDTGGVLAQIVATRHADRIARLVLTPTDAFDNFLPALFRPLQLAAKVPPLLYAAVQPLRLAPLRRLPIAFGWLSKRRPDPAVEADWVRPFFSDKRVRRDVTEFLAAIDKRYTQETAQALRSFDKPALIAWATEDKVFPREHAEELARRIPDSRLEWIEAARVLFAERGYSAVPAEEIVRAAGVTRGALYHHFEDKKDLFRAVHESLEEELVARIGSTIQGEEDILRLLVRGTDAFLDTCEDPSFARIALQEAPSVLGWAEWREIDMRYSLGLIVGVLRHGMETGAIVQQPAEPLGHLIASAMGEAAILLANGTPREQVRGPLIALLDGIRTPT